MKNNNSQITIIRQQLSLKFLVYHCRFCFLPGVVVVRSALGRFRWFIFFPAAGRWLTVRLPSVDVTVSAADINRKHFSRASWRCFSVITRQLFAVSRQLLCVGAREKSPRPIIARSASTYCAMTSVRSFSMSSGRCWSFHWVRCLSTWFALSHALFVQPITQRQIWNKVI